MNSKSFIWAISLQILFNLNGNTKPSDSFIIDKSNFLVISPEQELKCQGINNKGKQCGNRARKKSVYCPIHDPKSIKCKAIARSTGRQCMNSPNSLCNEYCHRHCEQGDNQ
ncbi:MAG: hypothetical protein IPG12_17080 [Saprospiraceae bacterium]|nr:hypothetical protein [Saprospiraceae bacterium]